MICLLSGVESSATPPPSQRTLTGTRGPACASCAGSAKDAIGASAAAVPRPVAVDALRKSARVKGDSRHMQPTSVVGASVSGQYYLRVDLRKGIRRPPNRFDGVQIDQETKRLIPLAF